MGETGMNIVEAIDKEVAEIDEAIAYLEGRRDALRELRDSIVEEPSAVPDSAAPKRGAGARPDSGNDAPGEPAWAEVLRRFAGEEVTAAKLAEERGAGTVNRAGAFLGAACRRGIIRRVGKGVYRLVGDTGHDDA